MMTGVLHARPWHLRAAVWPALAWLVCAAAIATAQEGRTISGEVLSSETNAPLQGATVRIHIPTEDSTAARFGAVTDAQGRFTVAVPHMGDLEATISFVGYSRQEIAFPVGTDAVLVLLEPDDTRTTPVQVIAVKRTRSVEDACCRVESIRDEVQQHAPFAPNAVEALTRYSSCTSTRIGCAFDGAASTRLRGLEPTYINVLLDGAPVFTGLSTFYGLTMVPANALQTIRIAEGASSGMYGNGAISGVVNLETRPPTEIPEFNVSGTLYGDDDRIPGATDVNMAYTTLWGDVGVAAFGSYANHADDDGGIERHRQRLSGLVKANMLVDDVTELTLSTLLGSTWGTGSYLPSTGAQRYHEDVDLTRFDVALRGARSLAEESEIMIAATLSLVNAQGRYGAQPLDAEQGTIHGEAGYAGVLGSHLLRAGVQYHVDQLYDYGATNLGYEITTLGAYLQDELTLSEEWGLLGSVRFDAHRMGSLVSPRGAIRYAPLPSMTMRLMAGQGFKTDAQFNEDIRTLHGIVGYRRNWSFEHERSFTLNYDISYRFLLGDAAGIDANFNVYHTMISGKAVPQQDSLAAGTLFFVNSEEPARLRGLELQLRPTWGAEWSGSFALALIDYTLRDSAGIYQTVPLAPRINVDMSLMYNAPHTTAEVWGSYIGSQVLPPNPADRERSDAYVNLNARFEQRFGSVGIYVGAFNLLDVRQSNTMPLVFETEAQHIDGTVVWGPLEGREVFIGARLTLGGSEEEEK